MRISVKTDEITQELSNAFDFEFTGTTEFCVPKFEKPNNFNLGLIVGPSGSGKSTLLKKIGDIKNITWNSEKAICSHFQNANDAKDKLGAVGLNSIPAWMKPYHVLSNGEKFRADLAMRIEDRAIIDEFTSVIDRNVAKSCSHSIQKYIRQKNLKDVVFASCHYDIIEWLQPDWVFDASTETFSVRGLKRRPDITISLIETTVQAWSLFRNHHYLSANINKSARCWIAVWEEVPVGFASIIAFPSGTVKNSWREHRTVVLPEFQGLGIGVRISDAIGTIVKSWNCRYFSKTANYRMGYYRNNSDLWKPTSKNMRNRKDYKSDRITKESKYKHLHVNRICFSHEFIGEK